jgi:hypothetical protein
MQQSDISGALLYARQIQYEAYEADRDLWLLRLSYAYRLDSFRLPFARMGPLVVSGLKLQDNEL